MADIGSLWEDNGNMFRSGASPEKMTELRFNL
jgi:hypothetical protein